jgi:hypothetical protein
MVFIGREDVEVVCCSGVRGGEVLGNGKVGAGVVLVLVLGNPGCAIGEGCWKEFALDKLADWRGVD